MERQHLCGLTVGLAASLAASGRPREVHNRDNEETVAGVRHTGEGIVPRGKRGQQTEETTSHDNGRIGLAFSVAVLVANSEQQEGDVQEKEDRKEGHSGLQGTEEQHCGKDEPRLVRSQ